MSDIKTLIKHIIAFLFVPLRIILNDTTLQCFTCCSRLRGVILVISTSNDHFFEFKKPVFAYTSFGCNLQGPRRGKGWQGRGPTTFLRPCPHFLKIKYYDFIPFFDFQYEKIIFNCQPSHFSPCSAAPDLNKRSHSEFMMPVEEVCIFTSNYLACLFFLYFTTFFVKFHKRSF